MVELWVVADDDDPDISEAISKGAAFTEYALASRRAHEGSLERPMRVYKVVQVAYYPKRVSP